MFGIRIHTREYRELKEEISELSDLYTVLAERFKRWDARQRQRAKRGILDHDDGSEPAPIGPRTDDSGPGADPVDPRQLSLPVDNEQGRDELRERLHKLAKVRGFR